MCDGESEAYIINDKNVPYKIPELENTQKSFFKNKAGKEVTVTIT
mgnify:CR=1 FL=1|jgi:hypothetical protein